MKAPRIDAPAITLPRLRGPQLGPLTWIVGAVVLLLLIVPLAYVVLPAHKVVASRSAAVQTHRATARSSPTAAALAAGSPQAVAAAGVEAKTGLKYSTSCRGTNRCLSMTGQTMGQNAAAIAFSTAKTGGQECVGYVAQSGNRWQLVNAVCGAPGQVSPMVGQNATVHIPGNCVRVRNSPSLEGGVLTCLYDGSEVHLDGGPAFADGLLWWHTTRGWIAHTFLLS